MGRTSRQISLITVQYDPFHSTTSVILVREMGGMKCRDARFVRPLKGGLKANRAVVGTDARTVRPYMPINNQLVNLFTLSTR